jgi:hypothetical protein
MSPPGFAVPIVAPEHFVVATRDTGYRSLAAAVSELVDNSIQANATRVDVVVKEIDSAHVQPIVLGVLDNGDGMSMATLG